MSATLTTDVEDLNSLMLKSPVNIDVQDTETDKDRLKQYMIHYENENDKFLILYVMLKLKLVQGKILIFANDIDRLYKIKLFLEQFSIKACVLNSDLPHKSR
jgi:ATP-dependent RNA helicase DDX56/DBP9